MKRPVQVAAGLIVSVICLGLAVHGLALRDVAAAISRAEYRWLVPALTLYFGGVWVRSIRWQQLLRPVRSVGASRLFAVVVIGYMANNVLPFRLGEVARCYVLRRREGIAQSTALGTVLVERVMDGLTMVAFMGAALFFLPFTGALVGLMLAAAALFAAATVILVILVVRPAIASRAIDALIQPLPASIGHRFAPVARSFLAGLAVLGGAGGAMRIFALSCAAWLCEVGMYYVLMFAFPLAPSFSLSTLTTAVVNLGTLIPSSPGYVGVFDFLGRSVLAQFGVAEEIALAYVLVVHAALVIPITLLGFLFTWAEGLGVRRLAAIPANG